VLGPFSLVAGRNKRRGFISQRYFKLKILPQSLEEGMTDLAFSRFRPVLDFGQ